MKPLFIFLTTLFAVKADISHLFGNLGSSNSYLPPQRQPHHRYGPPASLTPNYYNNIHRPIQQTIIRQPSRTYGAPGSSYQQSSYQQPNRPSQVSTVYIQDITSSYHSQAPSFRQPQVPIFQPSAHPIYRPPSVVQQPPVQNIPVFQPQAVHQPASVYQAPIHQGPIPQTTFARAPFPQYQQPIQQYQAPIQHIERPIEQFPIERPIEQFPIQRPIEQFPIQRPIEQIPVQRPIQQIQIQRPIEQLPIQRPIQQYSNQDNSQYLPPLTSPGLTLPGPDPAPSFNPGATVAILPSAPGSGFVTGKTSSSGIAITGPSAPSGNYFPPPIQQHPINVPQTLPSGCGSCGSSLLTEGSSSSGLSSIPEPVPAHNLGPDGYNYRQP